MINILYEDNHILVVEKPINVPVQLDSSNDKDLHSMLKEYIKEKYNKPGNVYLGIVHRLDRPVGGVMVFAKTSKAANRITSQIKQYQFEKIYHAVIDGNILEEKGLLKDKLLKNNHTNIVRVDENGKDSELEYEVLMKKSNLTLVKINLKTGRSHQIRVQFSSRNYPLYGDQKYNFKVKEKEQIALFASSLSFYHPITKERMTFKLKLPKRKPWNLFSTTI
ncbi:MAG TPA: RluA family pseudouridine synthase [Tenericutes bacterium]|nr:RluA family pseudouridine synthase [Mycoplasmatota bacterium]